MRRRMMRGLVFGACLAGWSAVAAGPALLAVRSTSPWTLRDLERQHAALVGFDPDAGTAYVLADPAEQERLLGAGFACATVAPDVEAPPAGERRPDLGVYHTYGETLAELESLATRYSQLCRLGTLGRTYEGRAIPFLEISDPPLLGNDPEEPDILFVGCHHAREFMSVEVPLYLARTLLAGYGVRPQITRLVDSREIWIVPMLNVDGHVFQESEQLRPDWRPPGWRKNRRPNDDGSIGVDLNRNYGFAWGYDEEGSSSDGGTDTYRGSAPFSELETQAMRALVEGQRFVFSVSYHSFGGLVLYPWGYTRLQVTDDHGLFGILADSMVARNGYRTGNAFTGAIYLTNGEAGDYLYGERSPRKPRSTLAFTVELNSAQQGGFWPPDSLVAPTCERLLPLNLFVLEAAANPRRPAPPPAPVLVARQDPADLQHVHLEWSQPVDPDNPIDRYEVFEIGFAPAGLDLAPAARTGTGRTILARGIPRPASDVVALQLAADLEPLWDYAYIEARGPGGAWRALPGDITTEASPTGRNERHGITVSFGRRVARFHVDEVPGSTLDLALRVEAAADSPRRVAARAALDVAATYSEERRILDPHVHGTSYDVHTTATGLLAYGVAAVDADGQSTDSELFYVVIPSTAVEASDFALVPLAGRLALQWSASPLGPARFSAWVRALRPGETPGPRASEWARGDYQRVASCEVTAAGPQRLEWPAASEPQAVLLRAEEPSGSRIWGPWWTSETGGTELGTAFPNPFTTATTFTVRAPVGTSARLEVWGADGRLVRLLHLGPLPGGQREFRWDGRDAAGERVAAGIYWLQLGAGGRRIAQRVVWLR